MIKQLSSNERKALANLHNMLELLERVITEEITAELIDRLKVNIGTKKMKMVTMEREMTSLETEATNIANELYSFAIRLLKIDVSSKIENLGKWREWLNERGIQ